MSSDDTGDSSGSERLNEIIAEYLQGIESGDPSDREGLMEQHPELANDLRSFFADHDGMKELGEPVERGQEAEGGTSKSEWASLPFRRYATARDLADELARYLTGEPIRARPVSRLGRFARWCKREPKVAALTGSVLVLMVFVAVGSSVAAILLREERNVAVANLERAELAEETALANARQMKEEKERANLQAGLARRGELTARRYLYGTHINQAHQAWEAGHIRRVLDLLEAQIPRPGQEDLRGFEMVFPLAA